MSSRVEKLIRDNPILGNNFDNLNDSDKNFILSFIRKFAHFYFYQEKIGSPLKFELFQSFYMFRKIEYEINASLTCFGNTAADTERINDFFRKINGNEYLCLDNTKIFNVEGLKPLLKNIASIDFESIPLNKEYSVGEMACLYFLAELLEMASNPKHFTNEFSKVGFQNILKRITSGDLVLDRFIQDRIIKLFAHQILYGKFTFFEKLRENDVIIFQRSYSSEGDMKDLEISFKNLFKVAIHPQEDIVKLIDLLKNLDLLQKINLSLSDSLLPDKDLKKEALGIIFLEILNDNKGKITKEKLIELSGYSAMEIEELDDLIKSDKYKVYKGLEKYSSRGVIRLNPFYTEIGAKIENFLNNTLINITLPSAKKAAPSAKRAAPSAKKVSPPAKRSTEEPEIIEKQEEILEGPESKLKYWNNKPIILPMTEEQGKKISGGGTVAGTGGKFGYEKLYHVMNLDKCPKCHKTKNYSFADEEQTIIYCTMCGQKYQVLHPDGKVWSFK